MPPKKKTTNKKSVMPAEEEKKISPGKKPKPRSAGTGADAPTPVKKKFDFENIEEAAQFLLKNLPKNNRAGGSANQNNGGINRSDVMTLSHEIVKNSFKNANMDRAQKSSLVMRLAQAAYRAAGKQASNNNPSSSSAINDHSRSASIKPSETAKWSERFAGAKESEDHSYSGTVNTTESQNRQGGGGDGSKSYKTNRKGPNGKPIPITEYTKEELLRRLESLTRIKKKFDYSYKVYKERFGQLTAAQKAKIPFLKNRSKSRSQSASKKKTGARQGGAGEDEKNEFSTYTKERALRLLGSLESQKRFDNAYKMYKERFGELTAAQKKKIPMFRNLSKSRSKSASKKHAPAKMNTRSTSRSKSASKNDKYLKNLKKRASSSSRSKSASKKKTDARNGGAWGYNKDDHEDDDDDDEEVNENESDDDEEEEEDDE